MAETSSYAAFISYSHAGDSVFAERLQREVERFAKPWNRVRAVRLFRDDTNLTASPGLWTSIVTALDASRWLVLLASPETARSHWCGREVAHWLETHGSTDRILLVLTAGTLVWDDTLGGFDTARSTAMPPALASAFAEEPLWVDATWTRDAGAYDAEDPRMQRATVDVAAAIRELSKDELVGTAVREHRRTTLIKRSAQAALSVLLVLSIIATVVALQQRHTAIGQRQEADRQRTAAQEQARLAEARELAALSSTLLDTDVAGASTLAVAAYQGHADASTRAALIRTAQASPHLVGSYPVGAEVTAVPTVAGPTALVLGLQTGAVTVWHPGGSTFASVMTLPGEVTQVAQSRDASVVAASDGSSVAVAADGTTSSVTVPAGMTVHSLAVTPDGRYVWVRGNVAGRSTYVGFDLARHTATVRRDGLHIDELQDDEMVAPTDDLLVVLDHGTGGYWARISARDGRLESYQGGSTFNGAATAVSATGRFLAALSGFRGARDIQVWPSSLQGPDPLTGPPEATATSTFPLALAVDASGGQVAVADDSAVYLSQTDLRAGGSQDLTDLAHLTLTGAGGADVGAVRFLDSSHLVSVQHGVLTSWDLGQTDRLGTTRPIPLPVGCDACPRPSVAMSTDASALSVNSVGDSAVLTDADGTSSVLRAPPGAAYGQALWDPHEHAFVLPVATAGRPLDTPATPGVRSWPLGSQASTPPLASGVTTTGDVVSVMVDGRVDVQQGADGTALDGFGTLSSPTAAAVSPDGLTLAVATGGTTRVYAVDGHRLLRTIETPDVASLALSDTGLLAGTDAGALTMYDVRSGRPVRRFDSSPAYFARPPVISPDGTLVARPRTDLGVDLVDTVTGRTVETLGFPGLEQDGKLAVGFGADDDHVATLLTDTSIQSQLDLRDLTDDHLVEVACRTGVAHLTADAWRSFAGDAPYSPPHCSG